MNKTFNLNLTPQAVAALESARKRGYNKSGFASQSIVEKAERENKEKKND